MSPTGRRWRRCSFCRERRAAPGVEWCRPCCKTVLAAFPEAWMWSEDERAARVVVPTRRVAAGAVAV